MSRKIKYLVIHCTATPANRVVTPAQIRRWHTSPKPRGRGWSRVGYSDMVLLSGEVVNLAPYNDDKFVDQWEVTYGARGFNSVSRHVVYVGGTNSRLRPKDTRTKRQKKALAAYVYEFLYHNPEAKVVGHNQLADKACPSFDVPQWLKSIGVRDENIKW
ncbi:MAG: N-acetylmuramoyl-L-alanine amidase [Mameliella sp.]|nr:N-acetylmuramoyl-L-alanine amidase [Phaeodactylibacter sp.]